MNPILLLAAIAGLFTLAIAGSILKKRLKQKRQCPVDLYNNIHLGEMTYHDVPITFLQQNKKLSKWVSRDKNTERIKSPVQGGERKWNRK